MKSNFSEKIDPRSVKNKINLEEYTMGAKKQIFKAPEYWFRKNKNLEVMNFRLDDGVGPEADHDNMLMS